MIHEDLTVREYMDQRGRNSPRENGKPSWRDISTIEAPCVSRDAVPSRAKAVMAMIALAIFIAAAGSALAIFSAAHLR